MTIKEFAQLCACNTQTLRYYDKINLLKPVKVDSWSGYRYYDSKQAIDFVKIKNLQAADFTIEEIKKLLPLSDQQVYDAFDEKIARQAQKLERIREIQQSYLAEKNTMEKIVYSMTDYILSQCAHPEVLAEFGLAASDAPEILSLLKDYMNETTVKELPQGEVTMTVNDEVVQGETEILDRIHSFDKENLSDTILLNTGYGCASETSDAPDPDFSGYEVLLERQGWAHISDFFDEIPLLEPGKSYCLWVRSSNEGYSDDLSLALFLMGAVLRRQNWQGITLNCSCSTKEECENHFKLLCKKQ